VRHLGVLVAAASVGATMLVAPAAGADPAGGGQRLVRTGLAGTVRLHAITHAVHTPSRAIDARKSAAFPIKVYGAPSSNADLGRITTAPNGDLWAVEREANSLIRIKPTGAITEWTFPNNVGTVPSDPCYDDSTLPGCTHTDDPELKDLDVANDGTVWVIMDSGWKIGRFNPATAQLTEGSLGGYPYGKAVRIGPDGKTPWFTMSFDYDAIGYVDLTAETIVVRANAPECDGTLGRGTDGRMWCTTFDNLIRVSTDGNSGLGAPLPSDASYPNSVAPGPNGAVWVGRDDQGSMFTYPGDGNIGWVNPNTTSHFIRLGSRVAPRSLVRRGASMWFTSIGGAKGIGHITTAGVGAIVQVGNYHPTSMAFAKDGTIWFTDTDHNVIVRVAPKYLQSTNVNLGTGSKLRPISAKRTLTLAKKVKKKGNKRVFTGQAKSSWAGCRVGKVQVRRVKGHKSVVVGHAKAKKNGHYKVKVKKRKVKKGTYFVRITKNTKNGTVCKVADSRQRKVR